jgi:hypothetical protein
MAKGKAKKVDSSEVKVVKSERSYIYWSDNFKTFDGICLSDLPNGLKKGKKILANIDEKTHLLRITCKAEDGLICHVNFSQIYFNSSEPKDIIKENRRKLILRNLIEKTDFD